MNCRRCLNEQAYAVRTVYSDGRMEDTCDKCGFSGGGMGMHDIYFKEPYLDENLGSQEFPGAKQINSKAEKKYWLDKCGLREAGDRHHGATTFDPISHRHAQESLRRKPNVR